MHVFFLTEAFTIIEAVHYIIENKINDADAYIIKVTLNSEKWAEKLKETNVFQNVYIWDDVLLTYPITIKKCLNVVLNGKKLIKFMKDKKYDFAYYNNGGWLVNSIFYTGVFQNNKNAFHIYLEHVSLTYTTSYAKKSWYLGPLVKLAGFKLMAGTELESFRVFEPELMQVEQCAPVKKMPKINTGNKQLKEVLNYIFGYRSEEDDIKGKKIVIMEQPPYKIKFDVEEFWSKILNIIDLDQAIVKAHPRQKESVLKNKGIKISKNHTIPWEISLLNNDISNKIQISVFSGSCTSPKLMFDEEPIVILLYKLLPINYSFLGEGILQFTDAVAQSYSVTGRFFVPETFDELKGIFAKIGIAREDVKQID